MSGFAIRPGTNALQGAQSEPIFNANKIQSYAIGDLTGITDGDLLVWSVTTNRWELGVG